MYSYNIYIYIYLVAEFIGPKKVYTFSSIRDHIIPKSLKCTHSATTYIYIYIYIQNMLADRYTDILQYKHTGKQTKNRHQTCDTSDSLKDPKDLVEPRSDRRQRHKLPFLQAPGSF